MRIFVIHSGSDTEQVEEMTDIVKKEIKHVEILVLKEYKNNIFWKKDAGKKIKKSEVVLFCVGKKSCKSKNIDWEIEKALKLGKEIHVIRLNKSNKYNETLYAENDFTGETKLKDTIKEENSIQDFIEKLGKNKVEEYALFNQNGEENNLNVLFEQYKIFLQTSEDLVTRRQNVSSFYITVNSGLVAAFSLIAGFGNKMTTLIGGGILLSIVGLLLCISWGRIIKSYGELNAGKMTIIHMIEEQLPANLYNAEWKALCDTRNNKPYVSFTRSEIRVPKIFAFVYIAIFTLSLAMLIVNILFINGIISQNWFSNLI